MKSLNKFPKEFFDKFPRSSKKTAQELKDEARNGWNQKRQILKRSIR